MKIISRPKFLELPPGAICCEGEPYAFGRWFIKGDSCSDDYFLTALDWSGFYALGSDEMYGTLDHALEQGTSVEMTFDISERDGGFERDAVYCVLEDADIDVFVSKLLAGKGKI